MECEPDKPAVAFALGHSGQIEDQGHLVLSGSFGNAQTLRKNPGLRPELITIDLAAF